MFANALDYLLSYPLMILTDFTKGYWHFNQKYVNMKFIMGDYNKQPNEATMLDFCQIYKMSNLIKTYICYNNFSIDKSAKSIFEICWDWNRIIWFS